MNRDQRYRATHREERRAYMKEYRKRRRASKKSLFRRLLNKIWRTR